MVWWFLQVLCWHQTDGVSQRPGDELCSGRTVQGEHTSRRHLLRSPWWLTPPSCFRTTRESSTAWWRCTSCTNTSTSIMTRWVLAVCCSFQQSRRSLFDFLVTRIKHCYVESVIFWLSKMSHFCSIYKSTLFHILHLTSLWCKYLRLLGDVGQLWWILHICIRPAVTSTAKSNPIKPQTCCQHGQFESDWRDVKFLTDAAHHEDRS